MKFRTVLCVAVISIYLISAGSLLPVARANPTVDHSIYSELLKKYVGKYELTPDFAITITKEEKQMKAQATGQPQFNIFPQSENKFYLKVVAAQILFNSDDENNIISLTLFQGGQEMVFKKVE